MGIAHSPRVSFARWHSTHLSWCICRRDGKSNKAAGKDRMIPVLLWLMATVDAGFIGYREAASRSALIDKRAWYRRAMLRGALFGQAAVIIAGIAIGASIRICA